MNRRDFIRTLGAGFILLFTGFRFLGRNKKNIIRPPGSIEEEDFNYKCVRCGNCILACPAKCLKPVTFDKGIVEWGTPHILARQAGCIMCLSCFKVCPSSAIIKIPANMVKIGTAEINKTRCLVWLYQKDCLVCLEYCPVGAICSDKKGRPFVDEKVCIGCGLCEQNCPVKGISAIRVSNKGERRYHLRERKYE